jgi:hypothetical protein
MPRGLISSLTAAEGAAVVPGFALLAVAGVALFAGWAFAPAEGTLLNASSFIEFAPQ